MYDSTLKSVFAFAMPIIYFKLSVHLIFQLYFESFYY